MRDGLPLTDADRADWLDRLAAELRLQAGGAVLTCSALKASYRERLRSASSGLRLAWLDLDPASAEERVPQRAAHFFPKGLVASQFEALESPAGEPGVLRLDALLPPEAIAEHVVRWTAEHDASCAPAQDETTMKARKRPCIALIAHNLMKDRMVALAQEFRVVLARYSLVATGTMGACLRSEVGLEVECLLSGPRRLPPTARDGAPPRSGAQRAGLHESRPRLGGLGLKLPGSQGRPRGMHNCHPCSSTPK